MSPAVAKLGETEVWGQREGGLEGRGAARAGRAPTWSRSCGRNQPAEPATGGGLGGERAGVTADLILRGALHSGAEVLEGGVGLQKGGFWWGPLRVGYAVHGLRLETLVNF